MSGDKQHYIPQFLQRGFLAPSARGERIWVIPARGTPRLQRIVEVARERHFYSHRQAEGGALDDAITDLEGRLAPILARWRQPAPDPVEPAEAAWLVDHLSVRSAHVRRTLALGGREIVNAARSVFGDEANTRRVLGLDHREVNDRFAQQITDPLQKDARFLSLGLPPTLLTRMAFAFARENFGDVFKGFRPGVIAMLRMMEAGAMRSAREGHNRALAEPAAALPRRDGLCRLSWRLHDVDGSVVLPDCVALAIGRSGAFEPLMAVAADASTVVMPVSSTRLLVGVAAGAPPVDLPTFNREAAACSAEFVLAAANSAAVLELRPRIGERAHRVVEDAVRSAVEELLPSQPAQAPASREAAPEPEGETADVEPAPASYPVSFRGVEDEATAHRIASSIEGIVRHAQDQIPLDRLDGFTLSDDYAGALRDLDRGRPDAPPLVPSRGPAGEGVGMTVTVHREGIAKSHVVMRADLGRALLSDDDETRGSAIRAIIFLLGHVGCGKLLDIALPDQRQVRGNSLDACVYPSADPAWAAYFAARASAAYGPDPTEALQFAFAAALRHAGVAIPASRLAYRFHGDMGRLLGEILPPLSDVLRSAAELIGHGDAWGRRVEFAPGAELTRLLRETNLTPWLKVIAGDLRELWDRRGAWTSVREFAALGQHVERLLWNYGIFPWETPEGELWVSVPIASDRGRLVGETMKRPWRWLKGLLANRRT